MATAPSDIYGQQTRKKSTEAKRVLLRFSSKALSTVACGSMNFGHYSSLDHFYCSHALRPFIFQYTSVLFFFRVIILTTSVADYVCWFLAPST